MTSIIVDTSALFAIALHEPAASACLEAFSICSGAVMSAGTLSECLVVGARRGIGRDITTLIKRFDFEVVAVTAQTARAVGEAYARWGKGIHPARLNFGDCFAYALAKERGLPLLYVGEDFARTDVRSALPAP